MTRSVLVNDLFAIVLLLLGVTGFVVGHLLRQEGIDVALHVLQVRLQVLEVCDAVGGRGRRGCSGQLGGKVLRAAGRGVVGGKGRHGDWCGVEGGVSCVCSAAVAQEQAQWGSSSKCGALAFSLMRGSSGS